MTRLWREGKGLVCLDRCWQRRYIPAASSTQEEGLLIPARTLWVHCGLTEMLRTVKAPNWPSPFTVNICDCFLTLLEEGSNSLVVKSGLGIPLPLLHKVTRRAGEWAWFTTLLPWIPVEAQMQSFPVGEFYGDLWALDMRFWQSCHHLVFLVVNLLRLGSMRF